MTLPLIHIRAELAFENVESANQFLEEHQAANYIKPAPIDEFPTLSSAARTVGKKQKQANQRPPPVVPLAERIWDCRASHAACEKGNERYRTVDLKGQI